MILETIYLPLSLKRRGWDNSRPGILLGRDHLFDLAFYSVGKTILSQPFVHGLYHL